jgi:hypothetical protein
VVDTYDEDGLVDIGHRSPPKESRPRGQQQARLQVLCQQGWFNAARVTACRSTDGASLYVFADAAETSALVVGLDGVDARSRGEYRFTAELSIALN